MLASHRSTRHFQHCCRALLIACCIGAGLWSIRYQRTARALLPTRQEQDFPTKQSQIETSPAEPAPFAVDRLAPTSPVRAALGNLDHADWQTRELAARRLVELRAEWIALVPAGWQPESAEARWRWQWVLERTTALAALGETLERESLEVLTPRLRQLFGEVGNVLAVELEAISAEDARPRIRQRALDGLANFIERVDLRPAIVRGAQDPAPCVRRSAFEVATRVDRLLAAQLIAAALVRDESYALKCEAVHAARVQDFRELFPIAIDNWRSIAAAEDPGAATLCEEIARTAGMLPRREYRPIYHWMLGHGNFGIQRDAICALEVLDELADHELLAEFLGRAELPTELASRAMAVLAASTHPQLALSLVPLLESSSPAIQRFAAIGLVRGQCVDYYIDLVAAMARSPQNLGDFSIVCRQGAAFASYDEAPRR
ncbi:MAG: hypothetical protein ACKVX7_02270 [Planctomycetota bacterium]